MDRMMTPEKALHWLIEFGSGFTDTNTLHSTWADYELDWKANLDAGWFERKSINGLGYYCLTQKAIDLIEENDDGVCS